MSLSKQRREYQALLDVSRLITTPDLDYVLSETLRIMIETLEAYKGSILLFERDEELCRRFILQRDLPLEMSMVAVQQVLDRGLAGWVAHNRQGTVIDDVRDDNRWTTLPDDDQDDVRGALCLPLMLHDTMLGIITLVSETPGHFATDDLQLAMAISNQASMVIYNARLFEDASEQRYRLTTILQNVGEPLLILNSDFTLMLANRAAGRLMNRNGSTLYGQHISTLSSSPMWTVLSQQLVDLDLRASQHIVELHDPETMRDYNVNISPVVHDTEFVGYVIVFTDITFMRDLSRLKSHMLRMASHDLKNPLNIALGYITVMQADIAAGDPVEKDWIDEVFRALVRMNNLIDELLNEQRIERESKFRSGSIDLHDLIDEVVDELTENVNRKQQQLTKQVAPEIPIIQGDRGQLRQAMVNYISNAVKYTPEHGHIHVAARTEDGKFYFVVEDNGVGIPLAMQDNIFRQGYRAERDEIDGIEGSGIGLSLVAEIARRHRGRVWFESEEGLGSRFGFWIPINQRHIQP